MNCVIQKVRGEYFSEVVTKVENSFNDNYTVKNGTWVRVFNEIDISVFRILYDQLWINIKSKRRIKDEKDI